MAGIIPTFRFLEIRNIADSIVGRASYCLIGRLAVIAERVFLKPFSHIRFIVDPTLDFNIARNEVDVTENVLAKLKLVGVTDERPINNKLTHHKITVYFNADVSTKENWEATEKALLKELGDIIFFSEASKRRIGNFTETEKETYLTKFVEEVFSQKPFGYGSSRPRFSLAKIREILENKLDNHPGVGKCWDHIEESFHKLLLPYLGHNGRQ